MMKKVLRLFQLPVAVLLLAGPAPAVAADGGDGSVICESIARALTEGREARLVVRTAIELGHSPCQVVRCAHEAGAELTWIAAGAVEAGAPPDVVSRCLIDAGASAKEVAGILVLPFASAESRKTGEEDPLEAAVADLT